MARKLRRATAMLHRPRLRSEFGETSEALFLTASFSYASGEEAEPGFGEPAGRYCYTRVGNPTVHALEERWAQLQGSEAAIASPIAGTITAVNAAVNCVDEPRLVNEDPEGAGWLVVVTTTG